MNTNKTTYQGFCADCDWHGLARNTIEQAQLDTVEHEMMIKRYPKLYARKHTSENFRRVASYENDHR